MPHKTFDVPVIIAENQVIFVGTEVDPLAYISAISVEEGNMLLVEGENVTITHNINNMAEGDYEVVYKVVNDRGICAVKTITVTVIATPEVAINDTCELTVEDQVVFIGDVFDPLEEVIVIDAQGNEISVKKIEVVHNAVNANEAGAYEVEYKITNHQGMTKVTTSKVMVIDIMAMHA